LPPHPCHHFPAVPFSGMSLGGNACHPNAMDGQFMPPTSCKSNAALPHILAAQGLQPLEIAF